MIITFKGVISYIIPFFCSDDVLSYITL